MKDIVYQVVNYKKLIIIATQLKFLVMKSIEYFKKKNHPMRKELKIYYGLRDTNKK